MSRFATPPVADAELRALIAAVCDGTASAASVKTSSVWPRCRHKK